MYTKTINVYSFYRILKNNNNSNNLFIYLFIIFKIQTKNIIIFSIFSINIIFLRRKKVIFKKCILLI